MIAFRTGNILEADAEALVNTVNCVGIMGRGIALQFKRAFPANFAAYQVACRNNEVQPGRMFIVETGQLTSPRWIVNFPTKRHWRGGSRIEDIEAGLSALTAEIQKRGIRSIAIPPLGSGLGGLDWRAIRPLIERALSPLEGVAVTVFEPSGEPAPALAKSATPPPMTPGRAALVSLMDRYLAGFMDPAVTLLEVHKLLYFLQVAGQPLRLRFVKHLFGPYAENLRHVLTAIEGHFVTGYRDGGDAPHKEIELVPGAVAEARLVLEREGETKPRFERVARLVDGFETPDGLELLATVHWVVAEEGARSPEEVVERVHAWNERKRRFTARQIGIAHQTLSEQGWLPSR